READRRRATGASRERVPPPLHRGSAQRLILREPCHSFGVDCMVRILSRLVCNIKLGPLVARNGSLTVGNNSLDKGGFIISGSHDAHPSPPQPTAGDGSLRVDSLKAALSRSGCLVTACSKHNDSYKAGLGEPWDLVAVARGDGTVAKAARHMPDRSVPLALLPTGTANNVAHSLDLLGEAEELAPICGQLPHVRSTSDSAKGP